MKKNNNVNKLSSGNKVIGVISFISMFILDVAMIISFIQNFWVVFLLGIILIVYSFYSSKVNYVFVVGDELVIKNIFKPTIYKKLKLFKDVSVVIPLTHFMRLSFNDNAHFYFIGRSVKVINKILSDAFLHSSNGPGLQ